MDTKGGMLILANSSLLYYPDYLEETTFIRLDEAKCFLCQM